MAANNMIVQNNIAALNVHRNMKNVGGMQMKASERLASGYKINRASDDAAGLAISEKMRGQIRGLNMASKNVDDAVSLVKTAEGGMQGIDDMLHRIRELLDFGSNDTNENNNIGTGDRQKIQDEIDQLVEEIDSMSDRVEYNKKKLIDGSWQDTTEQLNSSKGLVDGLSLDKVKADANATAANTNLTTQTNALKTAQAAQKTGKTAYSTAVGNLATAKATYDGLVDSYNVAKEALEDVAANSGLGTNWSSWTTTAVCALGGIKLGEISAAVSAYNAAAKALGIDELGLGDTATSLSTDVKNALNTVTVDVNATLADNWPDAMGVSATAGVSAWNLAQNTMATAEAAYQTLVNATEVAQAKVDRAQGTFDTTVTLQKNASVRLGAANRSLQAATELDNAGTSKPLHFQIGANGGQSLYMSIGSLKSDTLGIGDGKGNTSINVLKDTGADITATIDVIDQALSYVTTERSKLGAAVNRMEYTQQSLDITSENLSDAESRIRDADMAEEMMNKTKADTLQQVAVAMMSQANQQPQSILQLLR